MAVAMGVAVAPVQMAMAHPPAVAMVMMPMVAMPVPAMPMMMMAVAMPGLLDHAVLNCGRSRRGLWQSWGGGCRRECCAGDEE
jgi:hypothetical protein